jgi:hypothetical protein
MFFFFSLQHSISIRHSSLPSILSSNFPALFSAFTLSLLLHCSLTTMYSGVSLSTPTTHLRYFSCTLYTFSSFFHSQISAPYINTLSNIIILFLKSLSHFLFLIPHIRFAYLTISLICALSVALSLNV